MGYIPPMKHDKQISLRIGEEYLRALDDLRRKEDDVPSRTEMLRRLIERAGK